MPQLYARMVNVISLSLYLINQYSSEVKINIHGNVSKLTHSTCALSFSHTVRALCFWCSSSMWTVLIANNANNDDQWRHEKGEWGKIQLEALPHPHFPQLQNQPYSAIFGTPSVSGVTCGGGGDRGVHPRDFWPGNFCWPTGKREARQKEKKNENGEKRRKIGKGEVENWKWKEGKLQNEQRTFFFAFQNHFASTKMQILHREKSQEKWLCPLRKFSPLHSVKNFASSMPLHKNLVPSLKTVKWWLLHVL